MRALILWPVLLAFLALGAVFGLVIVPIAALGLSEAATALPAWAYPWDNSDDTINGPIENRGTSWWRRVWFLAFRNPAHNLGHMLGFEETPDTTYRTLGNPLTSDDVGGESGLLLVWAQTLRDKEIEPAWMVYAVWRYPFWRTRCLRVKVGSKLAPFRDRQAQPHHTAALACSINPFHGYRGK